MARKSRRSTPPAEASPAAGPSEQKPTVVGIGASAGGLGALKSFFRNVPEGAGISYVVVVHLAPGHESHLADLLQPICPLPVTQVTSTVTLEPDRVYVIAPGNELSAIDSHLRSTERVGGPRERSPIDHFFRTLAETHDGHAVAVVLTGTGTDGAMGIRFIKEKGGVTIVQDPAEAEWDGMPRAALATGMVDLVLPVAEMPARIAALVFTKPDVPAIEDHKPSDEATERLMQQIFTQIRARTGQDFSGYKRSTVGRRIERRMQLAQIVRLNDYLDLLRRDPREVTALAEDLLITVTSFFRDPAVFEKLSADVLPGFFEGRGPNERVRVWSVGCATGEEAYSLAILLLEEAARHPSPPQIQIFASDLHEDSLAFAREAFYPPAIELDVSRERLDRFFVRERDGYRVRREVRDLIVFASHNLLKDPPFTRQDLISCRNLLIYLRRDLQDQVMSVFHYALKEGAFLLLGSAETVDRSEMFRLESKANYLYRRRQTAGGEPRFPIFPATPPPVRRHRPTHGPSTTDEVPSYGAMHAQLLEEFAPPSMVVNADHAVVHLSEQAGRYLLHPGGSLTNNVFGLVREELRLELRGGLHATMPTGEWRSNPVTMVLDGVERIVTLQIRAAERTGDQVYFLVVFDEVAPLVEQPDRTPADATATQLEAELRSTRERLQSVVEEYEASQEEMRASNEELQSMNEELRSTLEELETSKEELQSINEELQTVNQENKHRVEELSQLSADLQNLLKATDIATLFLDRNLRILRFTPRVTEVMSVRATDRGRPLADLAMRFGYRDLVHDAERVLESLCPFEREVEQEESDRHYLVRVTPYRTPDDYIQGIVITFVDVTTAKRTEKELRQSESRLRRMMNVPGVGALIFTEEGRLIGANDAFIEMFGYSRDEIESGRMSWRDFTPAEYVAESQEQMARLRDTGRIGPYEKEYFRKDGTRSWMLFAGASLGDGTSIEYCVDVSDRKRAEAELRRLNETLGKRVELGTHELRETRARLTVAEQHERRRIAEILHNDLQQRLFGLQLKLDSVRSAGLSADDPQRLAALTEQAVAWIRQTIDVVRRLSVDLNPPVLHGESMEDLLVWLQAQMLELHGLRVVLDTDDDLPAPPAPEPETRILVFHALRELLFNVVKHAGVNTARLTMRRDDGKLIVGVQDGGQGFDADASATPASDGGYGLFSIRDRLLLVGGDMSVDSSPGRGTLVTLRIPLAAPGAPTRP